MAFASFASDSQPAMSLSRPVMSSARLAASDSAFWIAAWRSSISASASAMPFFFSSAVPSQNCL